LNHLERIRALSKRQMDMYGRLCVDAVSRALVLDENKMPSYPKTKSLRLNDTEHRRIKMLKKMREDKSEELMLEQGFLINNALITKLAVKNPLTNKELESIEDIRQWQVEALAKDILNALHD